MAFRFESKTVLVTGAATGIGWVVAAALHAEGAQLALIDRNAKITEMVNSLADVPIAREVGVRNADAVTEAIRSCEAHFGRLDILINDVGIGPLAPAESSSTEYWERTLNINLASQASMIGIERHVADCASKAGLAGMTKCMALEWAPRGVTVNTLSTTVVETELELSGAPGEKEGCARAAIPARRVAQPAEVAAAVLYLASDGERIKPNDR